MVGATSVAGVEELAGLVSVPANQVLAGPTSGADAPASLRALVDADIPASIARDTEVTTAVSDHVALADPHTQYQKESEKGSANGYASLDGSGTVPDAQIPATIARDTEITTAITNHEAAADPHTGYQKESEKDAASGYAGLDANSRVTKEVNVGKSTFRSGTQTTVTGGAGATAIHVLQSSAYAGAVFIYGAFGGFGFLDLVFCQSNALQVVSSQTLSGAPAARTYTMVTTTLKLALAGTDAYTITALPLEIG